MLRLVITYPQARLFVVGWVSFMLRLSKYLFMTIIYQLVQLYLLICMIISDLFL